VGTGAGRAAGEDVAGLLDGASKYRRSEASGGRQV